VDVGLRKTKANINSAIVMALPLLDPVFHQTVRTRVSVLLYKGGASFSQLKAALDITDGNLDAHLRKLSAAGYLHSQMVRDGRPHTLYQLSDSGTKAFRQYRDSLRLLLKQSGK